MLGHYYVRLTSLRHTFFVKSVKYTLCQSYLVCRDWAESRNECAQTNLKRIGGGEYPFPTFRSTYVNLKNANYLYSACSNPTNVVLVIVLSIIIGKGAWYWDRYRDSKRFWDDVWLVKGYIAEFADVAKKTYAIWRILA